MGLLKLSPLCYIGTVFARLIIENLRVRPTVLVLQSLGSLGQLGGSLTLTIIKRCG